KACTRPKEQRRFLADGFVPYLRVGAVGMIVDVVEWLHQFAQDHLVMEDARGARVAVEGVRLRLTLCEVSAVEGGLLGRDDASCQVRHLVALEPAIGGPEHETEAGAARARGG